VRTSFEYRSLPVYDSAFSPDATMIVLAHGSSITLWDVETNQLLRALDVGKDFDLRKLAFVGEEGRFLVGAGVKRGVVVWDLLSCQG
jgi:NET1-associated nuclear protein 1 (U3 small nucleolar RNA-associated protein 17)